MNRIYLVITVILASASFTLAQENMFTLSGGYSFATAEDSDANPTGWRINGLYEYNPNQGPLAHGLSIGFISLKGTGTTTKGEHVGTTYDYTYSTLPIYYAPKYMFGNERIKGFAKLALGFHRTGIEAQVVSTQSGGADIDTYDYGFYGGLGAGFMVNLSEIIFLNAEYEWAYLSNSYYRDGFMNSVMGGIGIKF